MALRWIEGFETLGALNAAPTGIGRKYTTNGAAGMRLRAGRTNGLSLELSSTTENFRTIDLGSPQTLIVGFGFRVDALGNEQLLFFRGDNDTVNNIIFRLNSDGSVSIARSTTVLATTAAGEIAVDTWYYIEIRVKIDNIAGEYTLKIDGVSKLTDTNVDTQVGSNAWTDRILIRGSNFGNMLYDDIYILDETGTKNNTFLGNQVVIPAIFPDAAGDSADFTPDTGSNHERVDEVTIDDDTSYVESGTTGHRDLYNYSTLTEAGSVSGIQINTQVRDTVAGGSSLKTVTKSGTVVDVGPAEIIGGTSFEHQFRILELDPDGNVNWDVTAINNAQFGFEVG